MRIQELADRARTRQDTLRYWERFGLLKPERDGNGYRNFSEEDYQRVVLIGLGKEAGLKLKEMSALLEMVMQEGFTFEDLSAILMAQLERLDQKMSELTRTRSRIIKILSKCPRASVLRSAIFAAGPG